MWRPWFYVPRPSFEYSCWKRNSLYPIRTDSFVSLVLYLIHISIVWFDSRFYPFNVFFTSTYNPFVFIDTYVLYLRILLIHVYHLFTVYMCHNSLLQKWNYRLVLVYRYTGADPGEHTRTLPPPPPVKLEKIWFFGVKSWFFTQNTPQIFAPPFARRNFFKSAPPPWLEILDPPLVYMCFLL